MRQMDVSDRWLNWVGNRGRGFLPEDEAFLYDDRLSGSPSNELSLVEDRLTTD